MRMKTYYSEDLEAWRMRSLERSDEGHVGHEGDVGPERDDHLRSSLPLVTPVTLVTLVTLSTFKVSKCNQFK